MAGKNSTRLLNTDEGPVAHITNSGGAAPVVLVCEHASSFIPSSLDELGLTQDARYSHIAWDIGAYDLGVALCGLLDAPLVASRVSRLVYDCNRPLEDASATPATSEVFDVPGNQSLTAEQRQQRYNEVYLPFEQMVGGQIEHQSIRLSQMQSASLSEVNKSESVASQAMWHHPVLVTVHSFTPVYHGVSREVEIGLLHSTENRFATTMVKAAADEPAAGFFKVELNQPYDSSDGVLHTLDTHAGQSGQAHVMIEVNNKLIRDAKGVESVARQLATMIRSALRQGPD